MGLVFSNIFSLVVLVVPVTIAFLKRINIEEAALQEAFGEEYERYKKESKKLFPWVY